MTTNNFINSISDGKCSDTELPPIDSETGLKVLINHFLDTEYEKQKELNHDQFNTFAICQIIDMTQKKQKLFQRKNKRITTEYKFKKSDLSDKDFHRIIIGFCDEYGYDYSEESNDMGYTVVAIQVKENIVWLLTEICDYIRNLGYKSAEEVLGVITNYDDEVLKIRINNSSD